MERGIVQNQADRAILRRVVVIVVGVVISLLALVALVVVSQPAASLLGSEPTAVPPQPSEAVQPEPTPTVTGTAATAVITQLAVNSSSGDVDAVGVVFGLVEDSGVCTLSLTQGESVQSASVAGLPDAQSTQCGLMTISAGALVSGLWTAVLTYESSTTLVESEPIELRIQ